METNVATFTPVGYLSYCERRPLDCGSDEAAVLAGAQAAEALRLRVLGPVFTLPQAGPASVVVPAMTVRTPVVAPPVLAPVAPLMEALVERVAVPTRVAFVDPAARALAVANDGPPPMTRQLWATINSVNSKINRAIRPMPDAQIYGIVDYWAAPLDENQANGDCEDFVLQKQQALLRAGVPRSILNIALVTTSTGESHAVLLVSTRDGEVVLDNLNPWVLPWQQTNYRWRERQLGGDPFRWAMVRNPVPASGLRLAAR